MSDPGKNTSQGQSTLELALLLPTLIVMLIGIAEYGRFAYAAIEVSNAAHAGVQYGAQSHITAADNSGMQAAAIADAPDITVMTATASHFCICSNGSASTCLNTDCSGNRILEYVQVNTTATVPPIFQYPIISKTLTLTGVATMRVEQ
jgi:Flp pilus assembly protein TadG